MNEERAAAGVDHLQTAALEMISAMRAFLDVAEEVVSNNEHLEDLTRVVGSVAQGVQRATGFSPQAGSTPADPSSTGSSSTGPSMADTSSAETSVTNPPAPGATSDGVQHIRVS